MNLREFNGQIVTMSARRDRRQGAPTRGSSPSPIAPALGLEGLRCKSPPMSVHLPVRKIVHVDMDAFYASVAQRDDPSLRGKPVVVAWRGARSVVCAASYEARRFGVRSAMPAVRAERLCPQAVFVPPDFSRYQEVSHAVRAIFRRHTERIEPLSLDEAYLDVSEAHSGLGSATAIAEAIRMTIREELSLTASAGVAPNKFLAKLASDWNKPDGLFVIRPHQAQAFLLPLPVAKLPGVGKVTEQKLLALGLDRVAALIEQPQEALEAQFGQFGRRLYQLARGIDESPVTAHQPTQSISAEDTLPQDLPALALLPMLAPLADKVWRSAEKTARRGHTVVIKLKTSDFRIISRSHTPATPPSSGNELLEIAEGLLASYAASDSALRRYRLVGVGLSHFKDAATTARPLQAVLF